MKKVILEADMEFVKLKIAKSGLMEFAKYASLSMKLRTGSAEKSLQLKSSLLLEVLSISDEMVID